MSNSCTATPLVEDDRTRVTRFDFEPGQETGWHVHEFDYVIVALTECHMELLEPGGQSRKSVVPNGTAYRRRAGIEHNVINAGSSMMSFVEVEMK
jgi:quercetin dioxygenase-like cupin family protein